MYFILSALYKFKITIYHLNGKTKIIFNQGSYYLPFDVMGEAHSIVSLFTTES